MTTCFFCGGGNNFSIANYDEKKTSDQIKHAIQNIFKVSTK
jgi:hypothetical protein